MDLSALNVWMVCRNFKKYEEVHVPAVRTGGLDPNEHLVQISEMEEWAQLAFDGYKCAYYLTYQLELQDLALSPRAETCSCQH